jgi:magnesium chelatase family protein
VLFLDELPEFSRHALEALREPLETARITLARAGHHVEYPAQFQLIAAMNPCPCGFQGAQPLRCKCTPEQVQRYGSRLSGPLLDRIDMRVAVRALSPEHMLHASQAERSEQVRKRCQVARDRALQRQGVANHALAPAQLNLLAIAPEAQNHLMQLAAAQGMSARAVHRSLRVAQTVADLDGSARIEHLHVAQALHYRQGH